MIMKTQPISAATRLGAVQVARVHSGLPKGVAMAVLVLVLWFFTAGAGFSTLLSSNLGRSRPAADIPLPTDRAPAPATAAAPGVGAAARASAAAPGALTPEELKRLRREQFDPPSLVAARQAPVVPGARALLEFAHPAFGIIGLAFWLGYSLVHARLLGWIAFGLVAVTVCAGLAWFTANLRADRSHDPDSGEPGPAFRPRMVAIHGGAAALTFILAALTVIVLHP
jgi:hypothetical protein